MRNSGKIFAVFAVLLSLVIFYQLCNANVILTGTDKGVANFYITNPYPPYNTNFKVTFAGTMKGLVDSVLTRFYCVDIGHSAATNSDYSDTSATKSKIVYILKNYFPTRAYPYPNSASTVQKEAAAIQMAIWGYSDGVDLTTITDTAVKARSIQITADVDANWTTATYVNNLEILQLSAGGSPYLVDTLQVIVRNIDGTGRPNVTVSLNTTNGSLSSSTLTTDADGKTPVFYLTKGTDSISTIKVCASGIPISFGTVFINLAAPNSKQKIVNGEACTGSKCDKLIINWNCSGGGGGGVESNYDMAVALFQRVMKIKSGQTTKILSNNTSVFPLQWQLQEFIPNSGPFNSVPVETTPFDILGISNATSAYACDYISNTSRVGVVFSTTTNPPEIYSHQKQTCDRLVFGQLEDLKLITVDNHQFYYGKIYRPQLGYTDNAVSFSIYQTTGGFIVDTKWTLDEYQVVNNAINVYNFQVWAPMFNSTKTIIEGIITKFKTKGSVSYTSDPVKSPDLFISEARYYNDGKIYFNFKNLVGVNQNLNMRIVYTKQQGGEETTINQNIMVDASGYEYYYPIGSISNAKVYFTSQSGFKDAVFVGSGIYAYLTGPNSTISSSNSVQSALVPKYPYGANLFPGGINIKGNLQDEIMITRSFDPAMNGVNLSAFDRLSFDASGIGKIKLFLEVKSGNTNIYPYIELNLNGDKRFEIPFRMFKNGSSSIDFSNVTYAGFSMLKSNNPDMQNIDFSIKNVAFYNNNDVANSITPNNYFLYQNYPNPFNPVTYIKFDIPYSTHLQIKVYDMLGRTVGLIFDADVTPVYGYEIAFDASKLSSGIYFYQMVTKDVRLTKKMVVLK